MHLGLSRGPLAVESLLGLSLSYLTHSVEGRKHEHERAMRRAARHHGSKSAGRVQQWEDEEPEPRVLLKPIC